ncbi:unknown [Anaerotruncus sp. CAG:390]|nr:unknown [Anaerotruncus sp. CAG:390]
MTGAAVHRVGMRRFIDSSGLRSISGEYARISALSDSAVSAALSAMSDAARAHFALEEIYSAAMDFDAKEAASLAAAEEFSAHYL